MADTGHVRLVEGFLDALSGLNLERVLAAVSDDFVLELPTAPEGVPRTTTTKIAFEPVMHAITGVWAEFNLTRRAVHPLGDDPNRLVAEYASRGTNLDGSPYVNTYLTMVTVKDGKITKWQEFFDPAPMVAAAAAAVATAAGR